MLVLVCRFFIRSIAKYCKSSIKLSLCNKPPTPTPSSSPCLSFFTNNCWIALINLVWTDPGWFIHQLEVQICFWSLAAL